MPAASARIGDEPAAERTRRTDPIGSPNRLSGLRDPPVSIGAAGQAPPIGALAFLPPQHPVETSRPAMPGSGREGSVRRALLSVGSAKGVRAPRRRIGLNDPAQRRLEIRSVGGNATRREEAQRNKNGAGACVVGGKDRQGLVLLEFCRRLPARPRRRRIVRAPTAPTIGAAHRLRMRRIRPSDRQRRKRRQPALREAERFQQVMLLSVCKAR